MLAKTIAPAENIFQLPISSTGNEVLVHWMLERKAAANLTPSPGQRFGSKFSARPDPTDPLTTMLM